MNTTLLKYRIVLRSSDNHLIFTSTFIWKKYATLLGISVKGPVIMPLKKSNIILLRSPHVNKKSRESFNFLKYKSVISFYSQDIKKIKQLLDFITHYEMPGVSLKIEKIL